MIMIVKPVIIFNYFGKYAKQSNRRQKQYIRVLIVENSTIKYIRVLAEGLFLLLVLFLIGFIMIWIIICFFGIGRKFGSGWHSVAVKEMRLHI